jgi:hypothetical protein
MKPFLLTGLLAAQANAGPQARTGVVTGIIRHTNGDPAPNVRVTSVAGLGGVGTVSVSIAQSDEAGRYRLEEIPPGRYFIVAGRIDAPTYYPGTMDASMARVVSIAGGALVADMDFTIDPASIRPSAPTNRTQQAVPTITRRTVSGRFVVEGRIADPTLLIPPGSVRAQLISNGATVTAESTQSGTFSLRLDDGDYRITVTPPRGYAVKSVLFGATDLNSQPLKVDPSLPPSTRDPVEIRPGLMRPLQFGGGFGGGAAARSGPEIVITLVRQVFA